MIIAIGDLHGHYDQLNDLLVGVERRLGADLIDHQIVFLGDYVDGGPKSAHCIDMVRYFEHHYPQTVALRGNHEQMLLDSLDDPTDWNKWALWYYQGGAATIKSYRKSAFPQNAKAVSETHIQWMRKLGYFFETKSFYFVHAGFEPGIAPEHNNTETMLWIRDRFINSDYDWGKRVVYGHTYSPEPVVMTNKIGIDTMMHEEGYLTAALLNDDNPNDVIEFVRSN